MTVAIPRISDAKLLQLVARPETDLIDALAVDLQAVRSVLREIADADPVDMVLDPGWPARIARAALSDGD